MWSCNSRIFLYPTSPFRSHCLCLYCSGICDSRVPYISAYDASRKGLGVSRDPYDHSDCVTRGLHREVGDHRAWHQDQYISWVLPIAPDSLSCSRRDPWGGWVRGFVWVPWHVRYRSLELFLLYDELLDSLGWFLSFSREIFSDWVSTCRTRGISFCVFSQKTPPPSPSDEMSLRYANWYWKTVDHQNDQMYLLRDVCSHGDDPSVSLW